METHKPRGSSSFRKNSSVSSRSSARGRNLPTGAEVNAGKRIDSTGIHHRAWSQRFSSRLLVMGHAIIVALAVQHVLLAQVDRSTGEHAADAMALRPEAQDATWQSLFDGESLAGWKSSEFGGDGTIDVEDGVIRLGVGEPLTGITYDGDQPLPINHFELRLQARRIDGMDFFCGLTFPYEDSHCTLIVGGWGGGLIGLSSLDGRDASENETTRYEAFQRGTWYDIRIRVMPGTILAWINDRQRVICDVADRQVSTRPEVLRSRPLGVASFRTKAEIRGIAFRRLDLDRDSSPGSTATQHPN